MDYSTMVVLAIIVVLIIYVIRIYNQLVTLRNRFQNAFAQIEVQLKRRYDLIPNLVETADGAAASVARACACRAAGGSRDVHPLVRTL